jgi:hypothetical protein
LWQLVEAGAPKELPDSGDPWVVAELECGRASGDFITNPQGVALGVGSDLHGSKLDDREWPTLEACTWLTKQNGTALANSRGHCDRTNDWAQEHQSNRGADNVQRALGCQRHAPVTMRPDGCRTIGLAPA